MRKTLIAFLLAMSASLAFSACGFLPGGENSSNGNIESSITQSSSEQQDVTCTITFKQSGEANVVKTVKQGEDLTDIPTPKAKVGYTVDAVWYTDEACTQTAVFTNVQAGFTVYAKATANIYKVSYDANGGSMSELTQDIAFDSEYTLTTPTHEKNYMRFDGWQMESGNMIALTGTWTMTENVSVTAKWTDARAIYTISFVQAGQETKTFEVKEGESFTEIPTPVTKTGYTVTWGEAGLALLNNVRGNVEVTAKEETKAYTITLDVNGGTLTQKTIVLKYGQEYELSTPSHNEKAFVNWTYNGQKVDLKGMWNIDEEDLTITLVALWDSSVWTDNY